MVDGLLSLVVIGALTFFLLMAAVYLFKVLVGTLLFLLSLAAPFIIIYWVLAHLLPALRRASKEDSIRSTSLFSRPLVSRRQPQQDVDAWVKEACDAAADIRRLVRKGDRASRQALAGVPKSAARLAQRARDLARLYHSLEDRLREADPAELGERAAAMKERAQSAADPVTREQYQAAAQSFSEQVQLSLEQRAARERLHAEIARILATLTNLRARLIAARAGVGPAGPSDMDRAAEELADLQSQVDSFQQSVRQVLRSSQMAR